MSTQTKEPFKSPSDHIKMTEMILMPLSMWRQAGKYCYLSLTIANTSQLRMVRISILQQRQIYQTLRIRLDNIASMR
jgi:hypothetical protein